MDDQCVEMPASLHEQIEILLLGENPTKAVNLINDENYIEELKESSWNIVNVISSHLTIENAKENQSLFKTCETLLSTIAEKCKPSETVLELLEQMESQENDVKFCTLLKPLGQCLKKLGDKSRAFDWCVNSIKSYVEAILLDNYENFQEEIDIEKSENRIVNLYKEILFFLEPLVDQASLYNNNPSNIRNLLLSLLLSLFGKPFCYLSPKSDLISESILNNIFKLTGDCFRFLSIVVERNKQSRKLMDEQSKSVANLFECACQVSDLAYANFYYLLMTKEAFQDKVPHVYDPEYILHSYFFLACSFLQNRETVLVSKGLSLIESIMPRVEKFSLGQQALESPVHSKLFPYIAQVMIFCESDKNRKRALDIFRNYVDLFTLQARYQVVLHLYKSNNHSGLLSLITYILKNSVIKCLEKDPPCPYFLGERLQTLLSFACRLSHGSTTDLIEIAEEIIAALNLIRFIAIRDKNNVTGFWDYSKELEKKYLKDLRTGIDLSRAHWKLKVRDLEEEKKTKKSISKMKSDGIDNLTLTVGGKNLSILPISERIIFSYQALNALDMIENVLIRVNECLEDHRLNCG